MVPVKSYDHTLKIHDQMTHLQLLKWKLGPEPVTESEPLIIQKSQQKHSHTPYTPIKFVRAPWGKTPLSEERDRQKRAGAHAGTQVSRSVVVPIPHYYGRIYQFYVGTWISKPHDPLRLSRKRQNKRPFKLGEGAGARRPYGAAVLCPIGYQLDSRQRPIKSAESPWMASVIYPRDFKSWTSPDHQKSNEGKSSEQTNYRSLRQNSE